MLDYRSVPTKRPGSWSVSWVFHECFYGCVFFLGVLPMFHVFGDLWIFWGWLFFWRILKILGFSLSIPNYTSSDWKPHHFIIDWSLSHNLSCRCFQEFFSFRYPILLPPCLKVLPLSPNGTPSGHFPKFNPEIDSSWWTSSWWTDSKNCGVSPGGIGW